MHVTSVNKQALQLAPKDKDFPPTKLLIFCCMSDGCQHRSRLAKWSLLRCSLCDLGSAVTGCSHEEQHATGGGDLLLQGKLPHLECLFHWHVVHALMKFMSATAVCILDCKHKFLKCSFWDWAVMAACFSGKSNWDALFADGGFQMWD